MRSFIICILRQNDEVKDDWMGRKCSTHEEKRNSYKILVGEQEGKRPTENPRCRWVYNAK
jgi:hypothetical protein